ncbi:MAG: hypothetical protein V4660_17025 [Pseudomonadota bacterium]
MKKLCYLISGLIIIVVIFLNLSMVNANLSLVALYFCLWGIVPWLYVIFLTFVNRDINFLKALAALTLVVGGLGVVGMVDVLYFHPDAQGGLVFVFFPLYQITFLVVVTPLIFLFTRNKELSV